MREAPTPIDTSLFGDPTPNAVGRAALVPADDLVVHLDRGAAPRLLWHGEDLVTARMPAGTRVVYTKPPIPAVPDRAAAIRYAVDHPEGMEPLAALLRPGMKVTVAMDDLSIPLPKMRRPDVRQSMLEVVLPLLAARGVDDVHLIFATSFHRRVQPAEMRRMVGRAVFDAFYPDRLYNHDGEAPDGMVELGTTDHGERVRLNRRAADSDLLIYLNVNFVPMDGGTKSVGVGLCDYGTLQAHHTPATIRDCDSLFDHRRSALTRSCDRIGRLVNEHVKVFHLETVVNNQTFDAPMAFFSRNEDRWSAFDKAAFRSTQGLLRGMPRAAKRKVLHQIDSPYGVIAVHGGATHPVHEKTLAYCYQQYCVPVEGQSDVVVFGVPYLGAYNIDSIMNPLLVQVMALGYFHNMYRGMPLVKKGGVMIVHHPLYDEWDTQQHPSYVEFFHRILPETRDALELERRYEAEFAHRRDYIEMYRHGRAYHGVHPFYMWYWGEGGRQQVGKVICVGAESREAARILGWDVAGSMEQALEMAESHLGRKPSVTLMHVPPVAMADVSGERESV